MVQDSPHAPHLYDLLERHLRALLGEVDAKVIALFREHLEWLEIAGGATLMRQGEVGDSMYIAISGRLRAYVSDGDSIWVKPADGTAAERLRLDGIDAPERCQIGGEASRAALRARILGRGVDVQVRAHDAYGRALASVRLAATGEDVAAWMVRQG